MKVGFTRDTERKRVENNNENRHNSKWELSRGTSVVEITRKARDLGWAQDKVQVRWEKTIEGIEYVIEPYEQGCGCRGLLKYDHFFAPIG